MVRRFSYAIALLGVCVTAADGAAFSSPILNKIPYIDRLYTNVSHEQKPDEKTLIILVTPTLVSHKGK